MTIVISQFRPQSHYSTDCLSATSKHISQLLLFYSDDSFWNAVLFILSIVSHCVISLPFYLPYQGLTKLLQQQQMDDDFAELLELNQRARNAIATDKKEKEDFYSVQDGDYTDQLGQIRNQQPDKSQSMLAGSQRSQRVSRKSQKVSMRYQTSQPQPIDLFNAKKSQSLNLVSLPLAKTGSVLGVGQAKRFNPTNEEDVRKLKQMQIRIPKKNDEIKQKQFASYKSQSQISEKGISIRPSWNLERPPPPRYESQESQRDESQDRRRKQINSKKGGWREQNRSINRQAQNRQQGPPDDDSSSSQQQQKPIEYKGGDFSRFAYQQQTYNIKMKQYIKKVIDEAVQSHVRQIEKVMNIQGAMQKKSEEYKTRLSGSFKDPQNLLKFLKDPIGASLDELQFQKVEQRKLQMAQQRNKEDFTLKAKTFIARLLTMRSYAIVENRLLHLKDYKLAQYMEDEEKNIYIPSKHFENYFLRISPNKQHAHTILNKNKMFTRQELVQLNRQEKQTIVGMVFKYLINQKVVVQINQIRQYIQQKIRNLKRTT